MVHALQGAPVMIKTAIILAAGRGSRLAPSGDSEGFSKPLIKLGEISLLERTVEACRAAGVERVVVVTGYRAEAVAAEAERLSRGASIDIDVVFNKDWQKSNGLSLLVCREHVDGNFTLMMSDHVFETSILSDLVRLDLPPASVTLAVDSKIEAVFDLDDATKVVVNDGRIVEISKQLPSYNAIDCGLFACTPAIFEGLAEAAKETGDCSLSQGMAAVARGGGFFPFDIGGRWWQDVDTPEMMEAALSTLSKFAVA